MTDNDYFTALAMVALFYGFDAANAIRDVGREDRKCAEVLCQAALNKDVLLEKRQDDLDTRRMCSKYKGPRRRTLA